MEPNDWIPIAEALYMLRASLLLMKSFMEESPVSILPMEILAAAALITFIGAENLAAAMADGILPAIRLAS
jgi:hypothetical protein